MLTVISPPKCDHLSNMYTITNSWHSLTLNSIRKVLRLDLPPEHDMYSASFFQYYGEEYEEKIRQFETLPELLLRSLSWLYSCTNLVDFFAHVWQEQNEDEDVTDEAIVKVAGVWKQTLQTLSDGSISCESLSNYYRFFSSPMELMTLLRTGHDSAGQQTHDAFGTWLVIPDTDDDVLGSKEIIMTKLLEWHKIKRFTHSETQEFLGKLLILSKEFLSSAAESALESWKNNYQLL